MKVVWEEDAERDFELIIDYVAERNPRAAERLMARIDAAAKGLHQFPEGFRRGASPDTRERVIAGTPYIMVYRIENDEVSIRAVFHAARNKPRGG